MLRIDTISHGVTSQNF